MNGTSRFIKLFDHLNNTRRFYRNYYRDIYYSRKRQVVLFNCFQYYRKWWVDFFTKRIDVAKYTNRRIAFFGVTGFKKAIAKNDYKYKFLYCSENVHVPWSRWEQFKYAHLDEALDLSVGFDSYEHERYFRFPYWLVAHFSPLSTFDDISRFVEKYKFASPDRREKFCAFICRKDYFGDRADFADMLAGIGNLSYPSDFRHNDDELHDVYNDNKIYYLRNFRFNLCPENSNNKGYVTEKVFDAVRAGCVPIYWGNEGYPEPEVLNPDAIIYLDKNSPRSSLEQITWLWDNSKAFEEFCRQPRFTDFASEKIYAFFELLERRVIEILKNK